MTLSRREKMCGDAGDWTPGLSHAKRTLYHWATSPCVLESVLLVFKLNLKVEVLSLRDLSYTWKYESKLKQVTNVFRAKNTTKRQIVFQFTSENGLWIYHQSSSLFPFNNDENIPESRASRRSFPGCQFRKILIRSGFLPKMDVSNLETGDSITVDKTGFGPQTSNIRAVTVSSGRTKNLINSTRNNSLKK